MGDSGKNVRNDTNPTRSTNMNTRLIILATLFAVAILPQTAITQEMSLKLVDGTNIDGVIEAARQYGSATRASQKNGHPMITGRIEGIPYTVRFRNCPDASTCEDMNLRVGFLIKPTPEAINIWNRDKRFTKAYLDADNDAILEMDVILQGGVSAENMNEVFSYWRLSLDQFTAHIGFN